MTTLIWIHKKQMVKRYEEILPNFYLHFSCAISFSLTANLQNAIEAVQNSKLIV